MREDSSLAIYRAIQVLHVTYLLEIGLNSVSVGYTSSSYLCCITKMIISAEIPNDISNECKCHTFHWDLPSSCCSAVMLLWLLSLRVWLFIYFLFTIQFYLFINNLFVFIFIFVFKFIKSQQHHLSCAYPRPPLCRGLEFLFFFSADTVIQF